MRKEYIKPVNSKEANFKGTRKQSAVKYNTVRNPKNTEFIFNNGRQKSRELTEKLNEMVLEVDLDGKIVHASKKILEKTGYVEEEINKGINIDKIIFPQEAHNLKDDFNRLIRGKKLKEPICEVKRKDGSTFTSVIHPDYILDNEGEIAGIRLIFTDISAVKKTEEKLLESQERYRSLFENSLDGIYRTTLEGKYIDANPALIKMLGYDSKEELLKIDIPTQLYLRKNDRPSPDKRDRIFETQLKRKDGSVITVEINSRVVRKDGKPVCYEGIVRDVTQRKVTEEKLKESYEKLKKTLSDIIYTLASIVEVRDPYTAGHQKRVAQLAVAIATQMGLSSAVIESIRIAALIHDIGKINLPASILTRPGRLSEIEYDMVKTHSKLSYNMLKRIDFPWPIAEIVLQHHERIDGSGYPQGLKDKDIRLEAKILAVADVVEAMASYRPYRPALGIGKAIEEINNGKGKLYDRDVVDACNRVVKDKNFKFEADFRTSL
jgi:PAS domain S-box-containing protein/putative nucleotidyltransferase with HDIG domain